ncbi:MAG TPA: hypothetical protein RMH99_07040 [Sandaracinaceae bacterium LLY-WYZ-13_1]|nr:hypothetical protein [Sandaracinaceae bacterium LLY-WYZ-13_1]
MSARDVPVLLVAFVGLVGCRSASEASLAGGDRLVFEATSGTLRAPEPEPRVEEVVGDSAEAIADCYRELKQPEPRPIDDTFHVRIDPESGNVTRAWGTRGPYWTQSCVSESLERLRVPELVDESHRATVYVLYVPEALAPEPEDRIGGDAVRAQYDALCEEVERWVAEGSPEPATRPLYAWLAREPDAALRASLAALANSASDGRRRSLERNAARDGAEGWTCDALDELWPTR